MNLSKLFLHKKETWNGYTLWTPPGSVETYLHSGVLDSLGEIEGAGIDIHDRDDVKATSDILRATLDVDEIAKDTAIRSLASGQGGGIE